MRPSLARGVTGKDAALLGLLVAVLAALHGPVLFGGRVYFINDLTHVSHPWRAMTAEQLQKGRAPLWNPYSYFGMPLLGTMQTGQFYPPSLVFHLFPFPVALGWHLLLDYALGGTWAYLWLRRWAFSRIPCLAGSAAFVLGGYAQGFLQFPNMLSSALQLPAFFLFSGSAGLLALVSAATFLSGYPLFLGTSAACLFLLRALWPGRAWERGAAARSATGLAAGLALAAAVFLPGIELAWHSNRRAPLPLAERLNNSLEPRELSAFIRPELARYLDQRGSAQAPQRRQITWRHDGRTTLFTSYASGVDPVKDASGIKITPWKSCYVGCVGFLLALIGFARLARRDPRRGALLALAGAALGLILFGASLGLSARLWDVFFPLRYIRGPARLTYLALAAFAPLIAAGLARIPRAGARAVLALALLAELAWLGRENYPTAPAGYYSQRGTLVDFLRERLGSDRFFLVPSGEAWAFMDLGDESDDYRRFKAMVYDTYKQKLFGIANAPFHLSAAAGGYESLFPREAGALIELLKGTDKRALSTSLRWAGVRFWLDREGASAPPGLKDRGVHLWRAYEVPDPVSRAYWLSGSRAAALRFAHPREDRLLIQGSAPGAGSLYLAEPGYPGWRLYVNGASKAIRRTWGGFVACDVPAGAISAVWIYRPWSWRAGAWISLAALLVLCRHGRARLRSP